MASFETSSVLNKALRESERDTLSPLIRPVAEELLCARSEDARVRIVENYIAETRRWLGTDT